MRTTLLAFLMIIGTQTAAWTEKTFDEFEDMEQWAYVAGLVHAFQLYNEYLRTQGKNTMYCVPEELLKGMQPDPIYLKSLIDLTRDKLKKAEKAEDYHIALIAMYALQERFPCEK